MRRCEPKNVGQMSDSLITAVFITLSGGAQDAYTYFVRGRVFANAQTGNIVLLGYHLFAGELAQCVRYLIPLAAYISGVFAAECVRRRAAWFHLLHWRQLVVLTEIVLLFAVGFMPQSLNNAANALVSFVCAMQVQAFRRVNGSAYASTMCIGNMRTATEQLCAWAHTRDRASLDRALLLYGVNSVFAVGAGVGALLSQTLVERGIWLCCPLLAAAFALMLIKPKTDDGER